MRDKVTIYETDKRDVNVYVTNDFRLRKAEIYFIKEGIDNEN